MLSLMHIASMMWNGIYCLAVEDQCRLKASIREGLLDYLCLAAAIFFLFFTFVMLGNQLNLIRKNTSTID